METFWKASALVLITVILGLTLDKQERNIAALLTVCACCFVGITALHYLEPVLDFLWELERAGDMQEGMLGILLRAVGIGLTGEIAARICGDCGNGSLGKSLQMLSAAAILYLSLPVFRLLVSVLQEMLGGL